MITIAICDDDEYSIKQIMGYCEQFFTGIQEKYVCTPYTSGAEYLRGSKDEDILLLDVEMDGIDGIEVKEQLERKRGNTRIIFISSHEEAMSDAYGWRVYGFLSKPLEYERFQMKMRKMIEDMNYDQKYVLIHGAYGEKKILLSDILYMKADRQYVEIYQKTSSQPLFDGHSIGNWNDKLSANGFAMSQKSYLVNLAMVEQINRQVQLQGNVNVPLSRRMKKAFQEAYHNHLIRTATYGGERHV